MNKADNVDYQHPCPVCDDLGTKFYSRLGRCIGATVQPEAVDNFYGECPRCRSRIEFIRQYRGGYIRIVSEHDSGKVLQRKLFKSIVF